MGRTTDCIGQKYGRLTVMSKAGVSSGRHTMWKCQCECGNIVTVSGNSLRKGNTKSCGCLAKETLINRSITHGCSKDRLYKIWQGIKTRCTNSGRPDSKYYVDNGIGLFEEWSNYSVFKQWAMCSGYTNGLSIDRVDTHKGYCPENCRWVTQTQQCNNRRSNIVVSFGGEQHTVAECAKLLNKPYSSVYSRVKSGKSLESW